MLTGSEVGPGYRLHDRSDGHCVGGCVTLDLCGAHYRSERLRKARVQVDYSRPGAAIRLSNEVVTYRPGGVARAVSELRSAVARCPSTPVSSGVAGVGRVRYRITPIKPSGLARGYVALRVKVTDEDSGRTETVTTIYQTVGNTLSGVYAYGGSTAAREALAIRAARHSVARLRATRHNA